MPRKPSDRPTLADVAKLAHVSTATASKALRDIGQLDQSTRDRVKDAARELDYRIDVSARALRTGTRPRMVALIVAALPTTEDPRDPDSVWERIIYATVHELLKADISTILVPTVDHIMRSELPLDATVLVTLDPTDVDTFFSQNLQLPVVVAGLDLDEAERDVLPVDGWINPEVELLVAKAFDHLVASGAGTLAFISTPQPLAQIPRMEQAARIWSQDHDFPTVVIHSEDPYAAVSTAIDNGADAILFRGDESIGELDLVVKAIDDKGLRIPDDVLLIAISESGREHHYVRDITTIGWNGNEIGRLSGALIVSGLNDGAFGTLSLRHTLTVRASTTRPL